MSDETPQAIWDVYHGPQHIGSVRTHLSMDAEDALELAFTITELRPLRVARRPDEP